MGRGLALLVAALVLLAPAAASAERTLALSTGSFEFQVAAGQKGEGSVIVMNPSKEPIEVFIYAGNQVVDEEGRISFEIPKPGEMGGIDNPASWLQVKMSSEMKSRGNVPYIELAPNERKQVEFTFEVPEGVPPGDHQILLFFEMAPPKNVSADKAHAVVAGRLASRIHIRVKGEIVERLLIKPFVVRSFIIGDRVPYSYAVRNEGNIDKIVRATVTLQAPSGRELVSQQATETTVYAGAISENAGVLRPGGTMLGKYTVRLDVEYPREGAQTDIPERLTEQRTVWVVPLWLAIAVVVVAGGFAIWASWRASVKAAMRKIERERREARREQARRAQRELVELDDPDQSHATE
ncbi:COG1470 family protein [Parvivirga hydrogeniphila]|uniref:COG1470 family protein n=1 Tax=Parvivirga hydrogeniphila TaxID=2939460 RepID=UPI00389B38D0